jgi:hypothetical protein
MFPSWFLSYEALWSYMLPNYLCLSEAVMNRRKQPPLLEDLVHWKVQKMLRDAGVNCTRRLYSASVTDRNSWLEEIKTVAEQCGLVRQELASLPVPNILELVVFRAVRNFAEIIASYYEDNGCALITNISESKIHHDICANLLKAVLLPCMPVLNVGCVESIFVQALLIELLYFIPNIKVLILPPVHHPSYIRVLVEKIMILSHLQTFHFHVGCTTEIIVELSKYCPRLKSISVTNSRCVEDDCVEHLLKFRHLHTLNLAGTLLSYVSYEALLSGLPHIRGIFWFDPIDPVLGNLTTCLPSVTTFYGMISDADLLVHKCPNLKEVVLLTQTGDISTLGQVPNIAYITVFNSCWTTIKFSDLVRNLGATLTALELRRVLYINIDDLIKYCAVLNSLLIDYCHVMNTEILNSKLPHFHNLKKITIKKYMGQYDFSSILQKYVNLNVFDIAEMKVVTDTFIKQIVTAGGFRCLTEICVDRCGDMTIDTALLLVQNCPNLTRLGNIRSWPAVNDDDVEIFLNFVRNNNLSLTVHR